MRDPPAALTNARLRTPRAAALAGIVFAVLYAVAIVLIRLAVPSELVDRGAWLRDRAASLLTGLGLIPSAGIAFLWFMGAVRDRIGFLEDQFFTTVFLGSGLLFLGLTFVSGALAVGGHHHTAHAHPAAFSDQPHLCPRTGSAAEHRCQQFGWSSSSRLGCSR
jgi:hypothetical protein